MLNYSEFHPHTGDLLAKLIADVFPEEEVAFIHGDLETAQAFGQLRFDHLFFTGSPKVGSIVSAEAGKNLVPVTMELGGRNPVVISEDADLALAASRLAATRMLNSGQICLCPDYAFVPSEAVRKLRGRGGKQSRDFFPTYLDNPNIVSIVNDRNYERVVGLIDDAVAKGATSGRWCRKRNQQPSRRGIAPHSPDHPDRRAGNRPHRVEGVRTVLSLSL
jgi:coniferyl-aldehyde dehydrogenase